MAAQKASVAGGMGSFSITKRKTRWSAAACSRSSPSVSAYSPRLILLPASAPATWQTLPMAAWRHASSCLLGPGSGQLSGCFPPMNLMVAGPKAERSTSWSSSLPNPIMSLALSTTATLIRTTSSRVMIFTCMTGQPSPMIFMNLPSSGAPAKCAGTWTISCIR